MITFILRTLGIIFGLLTVFAIFILGAVIVGIVGGVLLS